MGRRADETARHSSMFVSSASAEVGRQQIDKGLLEWRRRHLTTSDQDPHVHSNLGVDLRPS